MKNLNDLKEHPLKTKDALPGVCEENLVHIKTYNENDPEWLSWQSWLRSNINYRVNSTTGDILINLCKIGDYFTQSLWLKINYEWIDFQKSKNYITNSHKLTLSNNPTRIITIEKRIEIDEVIDDVKTNTEYHPRVQYTNNYNHYINFNHKNSGAKPKIEILPYFDENILCISMPFLKILEKTYPSNSVINVIKVVDINTYYALEINGDYYNYTHNPKMFGDITR